MDEAQIYHFSKGLPGFETETDFAFLMMEDTPFGYLQSIKDKDLSFLLGDPFAFYPTYEFELPDEEADELGIDTAAIVRCIITLKEQVELSTINLLAPIVLNPLERSGKQIVLHKVPYHTKHSLLQEQSVTFGKDGV
ncbi:Flagellar assembly factor FliW [compost metagenome]